jgi:glycosyltransferase involved in cell wall biosynthesis
MKQKKISVVIPVFNEKENIKAIHDELTAVADDLPYAVEVIFVDDGSTDGSLESLHLLSSQHPATFFIQLSRNFGQQYALKAGMDLATGDCVISMDCDLQHPPELIKKMVNMWESGYDVVYTRRNYERKLPWLKRKTSVAYYDLLNSMSDVNLEYGVADFRLLDRKVLDALSGHKEGGLFLRGLVKWVGFRQIGIDYQAQDRFRGESKYSTRRMLSFGIEGVLSFSTKPLVIITYLGIILFVLSILSSAALLTAFLLGNKISNTVLILWGIMFFCSLQMLVIGVICLYLSKLVVEARRRPPYLIRETNYPG